MPDPPMSAADQVPGIDVAALQRYLPTVLDDYDPAAGVAVRLLAGGRSNLTCLLSQPNGQRWVLRRPPLGHVLPTAHDMAREFGTLSLLSGTGFPAPRARALCTDHGVLGVTFLIYEYVKGLIVSDEKTAGSLGETEADHLSGELISALVRLHAIAPPQPGPGRSVSSVSYLSRQVRRFSGQWQRSQTRELPAFDRLTQWLRKEVGRLSADYPVAIVHGDYRLDNVVLSPSAKDIRAVLDWELSTLGDPLMDLALLLLYWEEPDDGLRQQVNVARRLTIRHGFWSRDRLLSEYLGATGLPAEHLAACLGLACLKMAAIMESIHYRHLSGQALDELSEGQAGTAPALLEIGLAVAAGNGLAALSA
jgi:aminoglycoside phosphotransferase (APT) family kinase protein